MRSDNLPKVTQLGSGDGRIWIQAVRLQRPCSWPCIPPSMDKRGLCPALLHWMVTRLSPALKRNLLGGAVSSFSSLLQLEAQKLACGRAHQGLFHVCYWDWKGLPRWSILLPSLTQGIKIKHFSWKPGLSSVIKLSWNKTSVYICHMEASIVWWNSTLNSVVNFKTLEQCVTLIEEYKHIYNLWYILSSNVD